MPAPLGLGATHANTAANSGEDVFDDSDDDKDEEAKARKQEFRGKMKEHYAKEAAIAMRQARELDDEEEEEEEEANGVAGVNGHSMV